jgi:methionyl-tRNA formyltransferase
VAVERTAMKRRVVYLVTPAIAVPPLRALVDAGHEVVLVVTRVDKRRGRGAEMSPSPVKAAALELGLPVSHDLADVLGCGADLGVVVAYGRIIPVEVLAAVPMVNLHFSLLPRWRGAAPVERAILAGDTCTGVCVMQVAEGLDTGDVLDTVEVPIHEHTTADDLRRTLVDVGCHQLVRVLGGPLPDGVPQVGDATYAAKIAPDDLRIDWAATAEAAHRQVRLGGAWTTFRGKRMKIVAAEPGPDNTGLVPGGGLTIRLLQPEGKAPMAALDYVRGARPCADERFE